MEILNLLIGIIIGIVITYLFLKQRKDPTNELSLIMEEKNQLRISLSVLEEKNVTLITEKENQFSELAKLNGELKTITKELENLKLDNNTLINNQENNLKAIELQKENMNELQKKFNTEFENIANKILEQKTEKFTLQNKTQLEEILKPLGENIHSFKQKVEEVYDKESKERFSLGERVKELTDLNQKISQEAHNLTNALKSDSKTQGNWGEMILETILERSGLRKGTNYFMEVQLKDEQGNNLRSDSEDKKMRPDAVIKYPDNRSVIIDSKVSLNAYSRYIACEDSVEQESELKTHINAIKTHINTLSSKGYDDYHEALDFVMMFIPTEPAYLVALQHEPDLWTYAYERRILLISPTNLITSLKLIEDLWKREYQNRNAIEIAERGGKLYDKFVGFVKNLEDVGGYLLKANDKYSESMKQLSSGNDNLVRQAEKLKELGVKTKKELSKKQLDNLEQSND
jgi:DNA recombination protein RmuC